MLHREDYVRALGELTDDQAIQWFKAGLQAIYSVGRKKVAVVDEVRTFRRLASRTRLRA